MSAKSDKEQELFHVKMEWDREFGDFGNLGDLIFDGKNANSDNSWVPSPNDMD